MQITVPLPAHVQVTHGSSDEAFMSKDSSQEELLSDSTDRKAVVLDSDGYVQDRILKHFAYIYFNFVEVVESLTMISIHLLT